MRTDAIANEVRAVVEGYNRDDCVSALHLRDWLEQLRASVEAGGTPVPRPAPKDGAAPEKSTTVPAGCTRLWRRSRPTFLRIAPSEVMSNRRAGCSRIFSTGIGAKPRRRGGSSSGCGIFEDELFIEKAALSGLHFVARVGGTKRSPIDRYDYPRQDTEVRDGDALHLPDGTDSEALRPSIAWLVRSR